jgi:hypothetical protein
VERLEAELAAEPEPATDAMLDAWGDLRDAVRVGGESLGELNERLRAEFREFRMDRMEDGVVGVLPVLRERPVPSYAEWSEAGKPLPSEDEARRILRRDGVVADGTWVTGEERIPAKPLSVPAGKGPHSQEKSGSYRVPMLPRLKVPVPT